MEPDSNDIYAHTHTSPKSGKQRQPSDPARPQKLKNRQAYVMETSPSELPTEGRQGQNIYNLLPRRPRAFDMRSMESTTKSLTTKAPTTKDSEMENPNSSKPSVASVIPETEYYQLFVEQKAENRRIQDIHKSVLEQAVREQARADTAEAKLKMEMERANKEEARANSAVGEVVQAAVQVAELKRQIQELEKQLDARKTMDGSRAVPKPKGKNWFFSSNK